MKALLGAAGGRLLSSAGANLRLFALGGFGLILFAAAAITGPPLLVVGLLNLGSGQGLNVVAPPGVALAPGSLLCPVPGAVETQPFGPTDLLGEPAMFGFPHFHTGIDLAVPMGTAIHAAEAGTVVQAAGETNSVGMLVGYGNLVRIATADRVDYYGHQSAFAVQQGETVEAGQVIGFVGSTGFSTGPHVHFEVRVKGTPVDPAPYMEACR